MEVPIPTHRERSPWLVEGTLGRIKVDVADLMKLPFATGPVLKAGPIAALENPVPRAANAASFKTLRDMM